MDSRQIATSIVKKLQDAGYTAYFAGGWVRDFILQNPSDDIDIASSASVEEVQRLFPKTIPVGVAFGIVIVVQEGHQFEIASFRKDRGYVDGRRPSASILQLLKRMHSVATLRSMECSTILFRTRFLILSME